jgi:putative radical SAM enzyme (TIGR03279 family)
VDAGLSLNCQIVVCAGLNDGEELSSTLRDLLALLPALDSVAVVPAGLTKYRDGLFPLRPLTKEEAQDVLRRVLAAGDGVMGAEGRRVVYPSDELFLQAGWEIPEGTFYDDYPQYENGVGMLAMLREEFETLLDDICPPTAFRRVTGVTGAAAYPTVAALFDKVQRRCEGRLEAQLIKIENRFFGPSITVAGLITGQDIMTQLKGIDVGDALLIPSVMLRYERDRFLDDVTVEELSGAVGAPIIIFEPDAAGMIKALVSNSD